MLFLVMDRCWERLDRWVPVNKCQVQRATSRSICVASMDSTMRVEEGGKSPWSMVFVLSSLSWRSSCWASISMVGTTTDCDCGEGVVTSFSTTAADDDEEEAFFSSTIMSSRGKGS